MLLRSYSPLPFLRAPGADEGGDQVHPQHKDQQHQHRAVLDLHRHARHLGGDDEDMVGQRHGGVHGDGAGRRGRKKVAPVNRMGAVSPTARSSPRMMPVTMPGSACGRISLRMVCHCVPPSEMPTMRKRRARCAGLLRWC